MENNITKSNIPSKNTSNNNILPNKNISAPSKDISKTPTSNNIPSNFNSIKPKQERDYKYYRSDFGELPVKVLHMDLVLDMFPEHTYVTSDMKVQAKNTISKLELNANNLQLKQVTCKERKVSFFYQKEDSKLTIIFDTPVLKEEVITIHTETICKPTANILEGIYFDETPKDCPQQMISQCQQWGFQRIVPCFDDMTAKCTYTTKIIADSKYTHLISNGNVIEKRKTRADGRSEITYQNNTPMAPYLFFVGAGTYSSFTKECEYASGKSFTLEILVPPKSEKDPANEALDMLYLGVQWINIYTGIDCTKNKEERNKIWQLIKKRDSIKFREKLKDKDKKDLIAIRKELKELSSKITMGYEYTAEVYREIGMQNSNFGGMENVGNTTIVTNKIMPFKDMTDRAYEYMATVKAHEFYHNLNGSEVTAKTPFDLWLNEAVTVDVDRSFHEFMFGKNYSRLEEVISLISPGGVLDEDTGSIILPIEVDGFNYPDDLITGVTYVKAPEFVRMIRLLIGEETYFKGLHNYHTKFKNGNAESKDWISAMEEVSKMDLKSFSRNWLKKIGYPTLNINIGYDEKNKNVFQMKFATHGWEFPFKFALVDEKGKDIVEKVILIKDSASPKAPASSAIASSTPAPSKTTSDNAHHLNHFKNSVELDLEIKSKPAFLSLNRDYSFYGKVHFENSAEELYTQARLDSNMVSRYLAFYKIADHEKVKLLKNPAEKVCEKLVDVYFDLLSDEKLMAEVGVVMLSIPESVEDDHLASKYEELYQARIKIMQAVTKEYDKDLLKLYEKYSKLCKALTKKIGSSYSDSNYNSNPDYFDDKIKLIKLRQVKNLCLGLISYLDNDKSHSLIKDQIKHADNPTDLVSAQIFHLRSTAKDRLKVLSDFEEYSKVNLVRWEMFLAVIGSNESDDAISIIERIEKSPNFRISQSNDQRIYMRYSMNKRKSLQTKEGREFMKERILRLAKINEYTATGILSCYGKIKFLAEPHKSNIIADLTEILSKLSEKEAPCVYNTIKKLLKGI